MRYFSGSNREVGAVRQFQAMRPQISVFSHCLANVNLQPTYCDSKVAAES